MKKVSFLFVIAICCCFDLFSQNYNNIVNYSTEQTATYGVKIKTNIPFENMYSMPYVKIEGFDYGKEQILNLQLIWYVFDNDFFLAKVSSSGGSVPEVWVSNENGKVSIFLKEKIYFQRFTVSAFCQGSKSKDSDFQGWRVVDEPLSGSVRKQAEYINNFAGKVGIGTEEPAYELEVNGTIRAKEIKVESGWADFVFDEGYRLPTLKEVERHIIEKGHLPNIPSEAEVKNNGVSLGEVNAMLLQKIEELTWYIIQQEKRIQALENKESGINP